MINSYESTTSSINTYDLDTSISSPIVAETFSSQTTGKRILLISSEVKEGYQFTNAVKSEIGVVTYNFYDNSLDKIINKVREILNGALADSIGFINHGEVGFFHLTELHKVSADIVKQRDEPVRIFWESIATMVKPPQEQGSIDLFACNLAASDEGKALLKRLRNITDRVFAASINLTGNLNQNADWILETNNIDVAARYFQTSKLPTITTTLATISPNIPWLDGVNTYLSLTPITFYDSVNLAFILQFVPAIPRFYPMYYSGFEVTNGVSVAATGARLGVLDYNNFYNEWSTLYDLGNGVHNHNFRLDYRFFKDGNSSQIYIQFVAIMSFTDPNSLPLAKAHHQMKVIYDCYAYTPDEQTIIYLHFRQVQSSPSSVLRVGPDSSTLSNLTIINREINPNPELEPGAIYNRSMKINYEDQSGKFPPTAIAKVSTVASDLTHSLITISASNVIYGNVERTKMFIGRCISDENPQYAHIKIEFFRIQRGSNSEYPVSYDWVTQPDNTLIFKHVGSDGTSTIAKYMGTPQLKFSDTYYTVRDYQINNGTTPLIPVLQRILGDLTEIKEICLSKPSFREPRGNTLVIDQNEIAYKQAKNLANALKSIAARLNNYMSLTPAQPISVGARTEITKITTILSDTSIIPNFASGSEINDMQTLETFFKAQGNSYFSSNVNNVLTYLGNTLQIMQDDKSTVQKLSFCRGTLPLVSLKTLASSTVKFLELKILNLGHIVAANKRVLAALNKLNKILTLPYTPDERGELSCNYVDGTGNVYPKLGLLHYDMSSTSVFTKDKFTHFPLAAAVLKRQSMADARFQNYGDTLNLIGCDNSLKHIYSELMDVRLQYSRYDSTDLAIPTMLRNITIPLYNALYPSSLPSNVGEHFFTENQTDKITDFYQPDQDNKIVDSGVFFRIAKFNTYNNSTIATQYRTYYNLVMWWEGRDNSPYTVQGAARRLTDTARSLTSEAITEIESLNESYLQQLQNLTQNLKDNQALVSSLMSGQMNQFQSITQRMS
ncbi:MAG: Cadherin [Chlamydiales bacterium]|jgi:hypothetical protein|nr:Cadherin [Chlamydiales bacterium]